MKNYDRPHSHCQRNICSPLAVGLVAVVVAVPIDLTVLRTTLRMRCGAVLRGADWQRCIYSPIFIGAKEVYNETPPRNPGPVSYCPGVEGEDIRKTMMVGGSYYNLLVSIESHDRPSTRDVEKPRHRYLLRGRNGDSNRRFDTKHWNARVSTVHAMARTKGHQIRCHLGEHMLLAETH